MSKFKKLIKKPNVFFYDYFRKKLKIENQNDKLNENINNQYIDIFSISIFKNYINDITEYQYNGKLYIRNKEKLLYLLYRISITSCIVRIVCDFRNLYIYDKNIINLKNLSNALKDTNNCYIEIYKNSDFISFDIIFLTLKDNTYYSQGDIAKIDLYNIDELDNGNYNFDIDIVYTYVNSQDEMWGNYWKECFGEENFDPNRYTSHEELKYSLRSINQFMPWVRNIYIVSNCSKPNWLRKNKQIVWIDHSSIFPSTEYIPTFNSHAIESCLHRIPNLAEHFIYFNDDVFLNKSVHKSTFFNSAGMSINFCEPYEVAFWKPEMLSEAGYQHAAINVQKILHRDFNYIPRYMMQHTPHALIKSVLQNMEIRYSYLFKETRKHKIRNIDDISTVSFFYPHYALLIGKAIHKSSKYAIVRENNFKKIIKENYKYIFLCFNSWNDENINFCKSIKDFFDTRYSIIPEWEQPITK